MTLRPLVIGTVLVSLAALATGCFDPIVGAECVDRGLVDCDGSCVDPADAPESCSIVDPPEPCVDCTSPSIGHAILIGHDYAAERHAAIRRILGNAVFIARGTTVRVLTYPGTAPALAITGARVAIEQVATELGRDWEEQIVTDLTLAALRDAEVLLIHSQPGSTDAELAALGATWQSALDSFVRQGGVVVLLDGAATHSGTVQILSAAGLVGYDHCTRASGTKMTLAAPTDALGTGMPADYSSSRAIRFEGTDEGTVVTDGVGPVVVHVAHGR